MREIHINIGGAPLTGRRTKTWGYPARPPWLGGPVYWTPLYPCTVIGQNDDGKSVRQTFEALRFGVQDKDGRSPRVVGLADQQSHIIKAWLPHYSVHSAVSLEGGAWQVYDSFLIHDGPDYADIEDKYSYATIGCIEIMGVHGFFRFNDLIIKLSGLSGSLSLDRNSKLRQIGSSKKLFITYERAQRPPLMRV